ncbi:MAG TPA: EAL domain-containing protein [Ferrovibrio sp.]|uniref:bifunctional diguanylate cyclase/phosphodiesterase n=1 Tax=Ferrovibrio sp. TaxID=1917215 RepID=UPI002B4B80CD|nr:EAL domain-containing protein [Ferrovibrio sp.]HLT77681.1 EAL domain-containing protein [Ferrovibrio sp.]
MFDNRLSALSLRVLAMMAALAAPFLVLAFYYVDAQRDAALEAVRRESLTLAKAIAHQQGIALQQTKAQLTRLAESHAASEEHAACSSRMQEMAQLGPHILHLALTGPDGEIRCASSAQVAGARLDDRDYFRQAQQSGRFTVSDVLQTRFSKIWTLVAAQPIADSERLEGMLIASLDLNWAQSLLDSLHLPADSIVSLSDATGRIVARTPRGDDLVGREILEAASFRGAIATASEGWATSAGLDGVARVIAFAKVPEANLYVRVGIPTAAIDTVERRAQRDGLAALGAAILLSGLLAVFLSRRLLLRPVRQLTQAAQRLGEGDWTVRTGFTERNHVMGLLARKLDELAAYGQSITRAFRTLSAGNRTLLRERGEQALLDAMCRTAVEQGGYRVAFVNYLRHDEAKSVETVARYGHDGGFIDSLRLTWADTAHGRGSVGTAIRTRRPSIIQRIASDRRYGPWRNEAIRLGFGSVISLPLIVEDAVIGTFTLIASQEDAFDAPEVELLDEMAADLSFGIKIARDAIRQREAEEIARRALSHDAITGLPNRASFLRQTGEAVAAAARRHEPLAVLIVHLPNLQEVYDGFGHDPANKLVREVAGRLVQLPGIGAGVARLAVNQFGLCLPGMTADSAAQAARQIQTCLREPVTVGVAQIDITASVGAAFYPGHGDEAEPLVRRAAIAARDGARKEAFYFVYSGATERENPERLALAAELRAALDRRELELHFQPKFDLATGAACGAEALIRWNHPSRGFLAPARFVPLAEETGLIRTMTGFVVDAAIRHQHGWVAGGRALPVAVNLSAKNLYDPNFLDSFRALLDTWGVPASLVDIELTESALVDDPDAARRVLHRLRDMGSKIYIDDFGTGYSSLNYLVSLPVHALKIDRSFVQQMQQSREAAAVVASVITMAHHLGLRVVAEGVETEADRAMLAGLGCDEGQGYLWSKPLSAADFEQRYLKG